MRYYLLRTPDAPDVLGRYDREHGPDGYATWDGAAWQKAERAAFDAAEPASDRTARAAFPAAFAPAPTP